MTRTLKPLILNTSALTLTLILIYTGISAHDKLTWLMEVCNQVNHLIPTRVLVKGGEITCKILK